MLELRCQKVPYKQIARILNRPKASVQKKYIKASRPSRNAVQQAWTPEEHQQVVDMRSCGMTKSEVARALEKPSGSIGTSQYHCRMAAHKWQPARQFSSNDDQKLIRLRKEGLTWHDIQSAMPGWTWESLYNRGKRLEGCDTRRDTSRWTDSEINLLQNLRDERGLSWVDIARHFPARIPSTVRNKYASLHDSAEALGPWNKSECETLLRMRAAGCTWSEVAARLGRKCSAVQQKYHQGLRYQASVLPNDTVQWHSDRPLG